MINSTVCITKYNNKIISFLDVNSKIEQLSITDTQNDILGNIYIGKVKHIVKNINAAFVEFISDNLGFLSFNDIPKEIRLVEGMDIPVQVVKEASKNKEAVLSMNLSIKGDYCIVENNSQSLNISRKISGEKRSQLKSYLDFPHKNGVIIRTKAAYIEDYSIIKNEIVRLSNQLNNIIAVAENRKSCSLIYSAEPEYIMFLKSLSSETYERIITDLPEVFDKLADNDKCQFYKDTYPLTKLYSLETKIGSLLSRNIWLKSGANIVIDITEAMTVIDINSAKNLSNKERSNNILALNLEATDEICRQIRLRNLSGIIIIDYINMHEKEHEEVLINHLKNKLLNDSVRCDFIDITKLGLVEIVRKKIKPPIYELIHD